MRHMIIRRNIWVFALLVAVGAAMPVRSHAHADISVGINIGPPVAPVIVAPPAPQPGYIWAPGYWAWDGYRHVWVGGHWLTSRPGHVWVAPRWERRGPRWFFVGGHWGEHRPRGHHDGWRHDRGHDRNGHDGHGRH